MKKVILSALVLGGLFACSKADVQSTTLSSNDVMTTPTKAGTGRYFHDDGSRPGVIGASFGCTPGMGSCPGDRIVSPNDIDVISDLMVAGANIPGLFQEHDATLAMYFGAPTVIAVNTGQLSVEVLGSMETVAYFLFSEGGNLESVVPLKK